MPKYDKSRYNPPAATAQVVLRDPDSGITSAEVILLIDTGADVTLLPRAAVEGIGIKPFVGEEFVMFGFDGNRSTAPLAQLDMLFLQKAFRGKYVLIDDDRGVLGRDVLASVIVVLDGPGQQWFQQHE